jgi:nicotinamide mononucleotide transporter
MEMGFLDILVGYLRYLFTTLEGWSFNFSLIYVILSMRKKTYSWFFAIIASLFYGKVCLDYKLYPTAFLQGFFILSSIYGFIQWKKASLETHEQQIKWQYTNLNRNGWIVILSVTVLLFGLISSTFAYFTKVGSTLYIESFAAAGSLVGQFLSAKRCLQNWYFWLIVNIVYVIVNLHQQLYLMTILYAIFVILSIQGYYMWRKNEKMAQV